MIKRNWHTLVGALVVVVALAAVFCAGYARGQQAVLETAEVHFNIIEGVTDLELQQLDGTPIPGNRIWLGDRRRGDSLVYQFQAVNVGQERISLQHSFLNLPDVALATITLEPVTAVFLSSGEAQVYTLTIAIPLTAALTNDVMFEIEFWE